MTTDSRPTRAVVIGSSIAGMLAAAAVAPYFDDVLVIERDELPLGPEQRRGVPHGAQFHALLARGLTVLDQMFPGFTERSQQAGAHLVSVTADIMNRRRYGWAARVDSDVRVLLISRPMLEHLIRTSAHTVPGIAVCQTQQVVGLLSTDGGASVTGVKLDGGEAVSADLVIDASGRASKAPMWLEELGFERPPEVTVDAHWGYTSCFAHAPAGFDPGFSAISALPLGKSSNGITRTRGAAIWKQEGQDRWIVTAIGAAGDHPPSDAAGFTDYLRSIPYAEMSHMVDQLHLVLPPKSWKRTVNRLRRFEALARRPEGFVVVGDAVAAFNPVYGQGMTVAALAAVDLADELRIQRDGAPRLGMTGLAERFQNRLMKSVQFCWDLATSADYRVEGVVGPPPPEDAAQRTAFMDRVEALASEDPDVLIKFFETAQLVRPPDWLQEREFQERIRSQWDRLGELIRVGSDAQVESATGT